MAIKLVVILSAAQRGFAINAYPAKNWAMRITHLDSATGTFRLEQCELPFVKKSPLAA
jgi:hypothetical protein